MRLPVIKLAQRAKNRFREIRRRFGDPRRYVKTDEVSGRLQFEILMQEGCLPTSRVLEVGCGCLHAGAHLMRYLEPDGFAGIEPNEWLVRKALKSPAIAMLVEQKHPRFLHRLDFDASSLGIRFNFVLSHSVLSHAAHWQLEQFLVNTAKVLAEGGKICASLRLAEGNAFGSQGSPDGRDSMDEQWQYPGVSWFTRNTVESTADRIGLRATYRPDYTEFYTRTRPNEYHDWFVFARR